MKRYEWTLKDEEGAGGYGRALSLLDEAARRNTPVDMR